MKKTPLILLSVFVLLSCSHESKTSLSSLIRQPSVLIFPPNTTVQTVDGIYKTNPTEREVWHSAKKIEQLEKQLSQF
jgi:hypothetical protein